MNRVSSGCLATIIFCACSLMPCAAELSVSLVSISPSVSDVTDQIPGSPPPGNTQFAYLAGSNPFGTSYTAVYSVSEEPGAVTGIGADISQTTYDSSAGQITINFTSAEIQSDLNFVPGVDLSTLFAIAFSEVSTSGDGPPAEFRGGYLATNVFEWMLIPPSPDNIRFGIELTGREGDTGFFRMFIPDTLIDLLSQLSGETLDAEDLAVFDNDQQASHLLCRLRPMDQLVVP